MKQRSELVSSNKLCVFYSERTITITLTSLRTSEPKKEKKHSAFVLILENNLKDLIQAQPNQLLSSHIQKNLYNISRRD